MCLHGNKARDANVQRLVAGSEHAPTCLQLYHVAKWLAVGSPSAAMQHALLASTQGQDIVMSRFGTVDAGSEPAAARGPGQPPAPAGAAGDSGRPGRPAPAGVRGHDRLPAEQHWLRLSRPRLCQSAVRPGLRRSLGHRLLCLQPGARQGPHASAHGPSLLVSWARHDNWSLHLTCQPHTAESLQQRQRAAHIALSVSAVQRHAVSCACWLPISKPHCTCRCRVRSVHYVELLGKHLQA